MLLRKPTVLTLFTLLMLFALLPTRVTVAQTSDALLFTGVWARATALPAAEMDMSDSDGMSGGVSAAYMTIENTTDRPLSLLAGATDAAGIVEIHTTEMDGDVMRMRPVEGGIIIPANESVMLEPGGFHVMLLDLRAPLVPAEALSLVLTFAELDADNTPTDTTFTVTLGVPVRDDAPPATDLIVANAWVRPTATGMDMTETDEMGEMDHGDMVMSGATTALYMDIINRTGSDDQLVAAATDAAGIVEIHTTEMDGDVMRMRPVEDGIDIAAGEVAVLEPGGFHVMLLDLPRDLVRGAAITVTLTFASGAEVTVAVPVYDALLDGMMMDME